MAANGADVAELACLPRQPAQLAVDLQSVGVKPLGLGEVPSCLRYPAYVAVADRLPLLVGRSEFQQSPVLPLCGR